MVQDKQELEKMKQDKSVADGIRDVERKVKEGKNIIKHTIKFISSLPIIIKFILIFTVIATVLGAIEAFLDWLHKDAAKSTIEAVYEQFNVSDVSELVELTGSPSTGYYWQFKSGVEEGLQEVVDKIHKQNSAIVMKDASTLMKFLQAEVATQLPNLGSSTGIGYGSFTRGGNLCWPTDGTTITSYFGVRDNPTGYGLQNHGAIDIAVAEGTNVYACQSGVVEIAGYSESAGNWVVINHGNGYVTKYMHNSVLKVSAGDTVSKGQIIALSGNTGDSTGPHVHFQVELNGEKVDPLSFKFDNGQGNGTGGFGGDEEDSDDSDNDSSEAKQSVNTLDNFLFIGDSRYSSVDNFIKVLGNNIKNAGVSSAQVKEWRTVAENGGIGTVQGRYVDITGSYSGISVQLGANSVYNNVSGATEDMKALLNGLTQLYPNTPIYVNSCMQVNSNATYSGYLWNVTTMKENIDSFNRNISQYCNTVNNLYYIDISNGLNDTQGFLKTQYSSDGLHCNSEGGQIFARNVKEAILGAGTGSSSNNSERYQTTTEKIEEQLNNMSLEEKVSQMFMVMTSSGGELNQNAGGYVLNWGDDSSSFTDVESAISTSKSSHKIPAIYATDDEGGQVERIGDGYPSAQSYGNSKNYEQLKKDEEKKAKLLLSKGINLNLAPVADLSSPSSYMGKYERSFGEDLEVTTKCVETVVKAAKTNNLSTCLKHFPGYGNNANTHNGIAIDKRSLSTLRANDLKVFKAGIEAGAPTILVSHNIVNAIDSKYPASLSKSVHNIIRNDLNFEGVIMTDDLGMEAIGNNYENVAVQAVNAGNDMLMTYNFESYKKQIIDAVQKGEITEERINQSVKRILKWKYDYSIMSGGTSSNDGTDPLHVGAMGDHPFQGTITIKRVTPNKEIGEMKVVDGKIQTLSFVEEETFNQLVAQNDKRALDVYTLNGKKQLITANWSYNSDTGLNILKGRTINYVSAMNKYTMPFEYLLSFLISGSDIEFTEKFAQLVLDSEIVIAVQDKVVTNQQTVYSYDEEGNILKDEDGNEIYHIATTENSSSNIELTYADCWFVKFYKDQSYSSENSNIVRDESSNTATGIVNQYTSGDPHAVGNEMKFITIFRESDAIGRIDPSWLYELLEQNEKTSNMIELTKYLFACVKDESKIGDETLFSFKIYEDNKFTNAGGRNGRFYGDTLEEKLWWALLDAGYSKEAAAGAMGNFKQESGIKANCVQGDYRQSNPTAYDEEYADKVNSGEISEYDFVHHGPNGGGYGLAQWTSSDRKQGLYSFAKSKGVGIDDENMQIEFLLGEMQETNGGADGYALANFFSGRDIYMSAETPEKAADAFFKYFERAGDSSGSTRQNYAKEIYNKYKDLEKPTPSISGDFTWSTTGLSCPRYYQGGQSWSNNPYYGTESGTIGGAGCGACALAMGVSGLLQDEITPDVIVDYLNSLGINTVYHGAQCSQAVAEKYGLTYEWIDRYDKANIDAALDEGKVCIFSIDYNGIYTGKGHFIMCNGRDGDDYYVLESGSYYSTDTAYSYSEVFSKGQQGVFVLGL